MSNTPHIGNDQNSLMKQYKMISSLRNINEVADRIEIVYDKMDTISQGLLKQTIANTLHSFMNIDELPESTKENIRLLIKQNMNYKIDIDYKKIDNEEFCTAYILKTNIQKVLLERKQAIYTSLTLNANY